MKTQLTRIRSRRPAENVEKKVASKNIEATGRNSRKRPGRVEEPSTDFGKTLQSLLGKKQSDQKVSEEEIYAAVILQQIKDKYGDQYTSDWKATYKLNSFDKPSREKVASSERAANDSMKFFVESTLLTADEAKAIKDKAFSVAQLDNRTDKLWDNTAGGTDKTIANTSFSNAQKLIQERLDGQTTTATQTKTMKIMGKNVQIKKFSAVG